MRPGRSSEAIPAVLTWSGTCKTAGQRLLEREPAHRLRCHFRGSETSRFVGCLRIISACHEQHPGRQIGSGEEGGCRKSFTGRAEVEIHGDEVEPQILNLE